MVPGWGKLPDGWSFVEATAVGVDSKDNVYVYNRGAHPVIIFDRQRQVPPLVGRGDDQPGPRHHDRSGRHRLADRRRQPHDPAVHRRREAPPVDRRSRQAVAGPRRASRSTGPPTSRSRPQTGDVYISDGYGNSRVHKYDPKGRLLFSWGEPGTDPGVLQHPAQHRDGRRGPRLRGGPGEPSRPGVRREGTLPVPDQQPAPAPARSTSTAPTAGGSSSASCLAPPGQRGGAEHRRPGERAHPQGRSPRASRRQVRGRGARASSSPRTAWCMDSHGDFYVAEVAFTAKGRHETPPREIRSLQKFALGRG